MTDDRIVEQYRRNGDKGAGEIPEEHTPCVQDAVDTCPVSIITLSA
jgi:ferredoxin